MPARFYAHPCDGHGERYCVMDGNNIIVSDTDLEYGQAHRLADEMNEEAAIAEQDANGRAVLEAIANQPSLIAAE